MDERQKQLVSAGEAMRKWIHAQRAMWAAGYPQSLTQVQPQLAGAAVGAIAVPSPVLTEAPAAPSEAWPAAESGPSWSQGVAERVGSAIQGTSALVRSSWKVLAAVAAVVLLGVVVRFAWPSVKSRVVSSKSESARAASSVQSSTQTKPSSARATATRAAGATTAAGAAVATTGIGRLQVESSPAGAHVSIDGKERGVTPLTVEGLTVGSHKVVVRGDDGSVQRTVAINAGETTQLSESIYSGWLHVAAPFEVQLSEGNKSITLDDSNQVLLPPGPHDVRFENRTLGLRQVRHIDIRPGETTAVSLETPTSHITVTASEPATVSIDGQPAGETPLTDFAVAVGSRDVTVTSASGVVRHQTITVKVQPSTLDVDFSKP
jgi:PEGA domain-containing protein